LQAEYQNSYAAAICQNNELIQDLYDLFANDLSHEVIYTWLCAFILLQCHTYFFSSRQQSQHLVLIKMPIHVQAWSPNLESASSPQ